ncbi:MAG: GNAT family N-acetyltransferase [Candidatus Eremiobacteraeota bacterium]|nr:GNAT family N-acetyltransferase [Candidatus Eremiobacteraeota bacterium]
MNSLQTARLDLLPVAPELAGLMFEGLQDPRIYEYIADDAPETVESLRERYGSLAAARSPDGGETWLNWMLRVRASSGFSGYVQATICNVSDTMTRKRTASIAYVLFPAAWGHGYAEEAVREMMRVLRTDLNVGEFTATVHTENARSIRLLERLSFTRQSLTKDAEIIRGKPTDEYLYAYTPSP